MRQRLPCGKCGGTGGNWCDRGLQTNMICSLCDGTGYVTQEDFKLVVQANISPEVENFDTRFEMWVNRHKVANVGACVHFLTRGNIMKQKGLEEPEL